MTQIAVIDMIRMFQFHFQNALFNLCLNALAIPVINFHAGLRTIVAHQRDIAQIAFDVDACDIGKSLVVRLIISIAIPPAQPCQLCVS